MLEGVLMSFLGESVFRDRLKDIHEYSIIKYLHGHGKISNDIGFNAQVNWELCVDVSGKLLFIINGDLASCNISNDKHYIEYILDGVSADNQWTITFEKMIIYSLNYHTDIDEWVCLCEVQGHGNIQLAKVGSDSESVSSVEAYVNNFYFDEKNTAKKSPSCKADRLDVYFNMLDSSNEIKELINEKRIQSAAFSYISVSVENPCSKTFIESEIDNITWFLSFLAFNTTFVPVYKYLDTSGDLIGMKIKDCRTTAYNNMSLVDNKNVEFKLILLISSTPLSAKGTKSEISTLFMYRLMDCSAISPSTTKLK